MGSLEKENEEETEESMEVEEVIIERKGSWMNLKKKKDEEK